MDLGNNLSLQTARAETYSHPPQLYQIPTQNGALVLHCICLGTKRTALGSKYSDLAGSSPHLDSFLVHGVLHNEFIPGDVCFFQLNTYTSALLIFSLIFTVSLASVHLGPHSHSRGLMRLFSRHQVGIPAYFRGARRLKCLTIPNAQGKNLPIYFQHSPKYHDTKSFTSVQC